MTNPTCFLKALKKYYPFAILFLLLFYVFFTAEILTVDDVVFQKMYKNHFEVLKSRFSGWSSRVIIEILLMFFAARAPFLWRILTAFFFTMMGVMVSKTILIKSHIGSWMITFLIILLCTYDISSAGWISTTLNYAWPAAFATIAVYPLKKMIAGERIRWQENFFYIPALIFAANHELMTVILLVLIVAGFYFLWKRKQIHPQAIVMLLIVILSLGFVLANPGNQNRYAAEIQRFFPDFSQLNIFQKVDIGISHTLKFMIQPNVFFLLLCLIICIRVFSIREDWLYRSISLFPLAVHIAFAYFPSSLSVMFPGFEKVYYEISRYGLLYVNSNFIGFGLFFIICVSLFCMLLSIYLTYGSGLKTMSLLAVLILGFGSRMVMGFSPTVLVSHNRTALFMYLAMLIVIAVLFIDQHRLREDCWIKGYFLLSGFLSVLGYLSLFGGMK